MKNLFSFFAFSVILFFASCTKEAILEPQVDNTTQEELLPFPTTENSKAFNSSDDGAGIRSTTLQINVNKVSVQQASGELLLILSCNYNLTGVTLENSQSLVFEDASGNESTLSFTVNNALGSNGQLNTNFALDGNDLTGLSLKVGQDIVIIDDLII